MPFTYTNIFDHVNFGSIIVFWNYSLKICEIFVSTRQMKSKLQFNLFIHPTK